ncbi:MAG TPA: DUF1839 domain-containing protein [Methylophilaceae bacterium]|nr:DUF1839 domain-containing protein [Methylophilaceae bacterium]
MSEVQNIFALTPETYQPHALHCHDQNFRETNCYSDLVIEIINGLGLNAVACLGYTLAADFEGDQWTFGKPSHHDLENLYGVRIEELSLYRALVDQLVTQVQRGSIPLLEADAFHLPDTAGIDYRANHVKTTIGITHIDVENKRMRYFHNATFAELKDEDFEGVLAPQASKHQGYLPPYCEIAKLNLVNQKSESALRTLAAESAKFHLRKRPLINPVKRHAEAMAEHQQTIIAGGLPVYHAYTFVALRQLGSSHQLGANFLRWLDPQEANMAAAATAFEQIASTAKMLVLKLARVTNSGKPADFSAVFEEMANQWDTATLHLKLAFTDK